MILYNERKSLAVGFVSLFIIAVVLAIRNLYSFSWSDESFYLAEIHRLFLGGKPFVDEWHPTQFYAVLFLPFYNIYVKMKGGGNEGVYLAARNLYLLLDFLVACYVFYIFRRKIKLGIQYCIVAGALVMLYSWANVMGISYHNIFFLMMIVASMLLINLISDQNKIGRRKRRGLSIAIGIFAGMGIITIPTAVIAICILILILFYLFFIKKRYQDKTNILTGAVFGMALVAILYISFILSRASVEELFIHVGYLFQDEYHQAKNFMGYLGSLESLLRGCGKYILILICVTVCIRISLVCWKRVFSLRIRDALYFISIPILLYSLYIYASSHMSTYVIFGLYGFFCMILYAERSWLEDRGFVKSISVVGITGCVMVGAFLFASATSGPMSTGFVCFSLITLMIIEKKQSNLKIKYRMVAYITASGMILIMTGMTGIVRVTSVYRDAPLSQMDTRLEKGPGKGLFTTAEHAKWYDSCMDAIEELNEVEQGAYDEAMIIVSKQAPWIYTGLNIQNGAPTAWTCEISDPKIETYYRTHDIERLKYVLVLREELGGYTGAGNPEGTFLKPNQNEVSGWLGDLLESEYSAETLGCGILYVRN